MFLRDFVHTVGDVRVGFRSSIGKLSYWIFLSILGDLLVEKMTTYLATPPPLVIFCHLSTPPPDGMTSFVDGP